MFLVLWRNKFIISHLNNFVKRISNFFSLFKGKVKLLLLQQGNPMPKIYTPEEKS